MDQKESYKEYLDGIEKHLPQDAVVLAHLNADFAIDDGKLFDYRNL